MGVEHGEPHHDGRSQYGAHHRSEVDHADRGAARHTASPEPATEQIAEGAGTVPVEVFNRVAQLEQQLQEAQAKLEHRRAVDKARVARWRANHPEEAKRQTRDSVAAYRARKR